MRIAFAVMIVLSSAMTLVADEHAELDLLPSGVDASFRGIAVVDSQTIFVGGSDATVVKSTDAGASWKKLTISPDVGESLDFRDIEVTADGGLVLISAGPGDKSRIFRSEDLGRTWSLVHTNDLENGFFNGAAFWDSGVGLVVGDPISGRLFLLKTTDFGRTWFRIKGPRLKDGEYGFAASGTGIVTASGGKAWVVTGAAASRVLTTSDYGSSWKFSESGIRNGEQGSGIFSVAVSDRFGIAVGGDYEKPELAERNCSWTSTQRGAGLWTLVDVQMPHKACVRFLDDSTALAVGRTGIMMTTLPNLEWKTVSEESFYTFDYNVETSTAFLAGADGRIGKLKIGGPSRTRSQK